MVKSKPFSAQSQARIQETLRYDPKTGQLFWRKSPGARGPVRAGDIAGCLRPDGYISIKLDGRFYQAHRLAYFLATGTDPGEMTVDHWNGIKSDNSFVNLRLATPSQQKQNQAKPRSDSSSDHRGVYESPSGSWRAELTFEGKYVFRKTFKTKEGAIAARRAAELKYFGEFAPKRTQLILN